MIYIIKGKYYIKTAPLQYVEVNFEKQGNELTIVPTTNKIEVSMNDNITSTDFQSIKEKLKLASEQHQNTSEITYRKRNKR